MKIQEFRTRYPEYDDMPDIDLATRFHAKYYSDIPFSDFASKFGVSVPPVEKTGKAERLVKQAYNVAIAAPAQTIMTKSNIGKAGIESKALTLYEEDFKKRAEAGEPVTKQEIERYAKPYERGTIGALFRVKKPEWTQSVWNKYQEGKLNVGEPRTQEEDLDFLQQTYGAAQTQQVEDTDISLYVSQAETFFDKAVDVVAGVAGFTAQLVALRKAFPGMPEPAVWEMQNQVVGGKTGAGAATYLAFSIPGKVIPGASKLAKGGRLAAESATLGGYSAVEQLLGTGEINWEDVAISAGIPVGLPLQQFRV